MMVSVARMVPPPSSEVELMACLELTVLPLLWAMGLWLWYHCLTGLGESVASQVKETVLSATRDIVMSVGSRTVSLVQLRRGRDEWEWRHGIHWANTCVSASSGAGRCGSAIIAYATDCPLVLQIASLSVDLLVDSYLHTTQHGCCSL